VITYCTNIHPGESWNEIFSNITTYTPIVKNAVSPESPFPIGLRLSNIASLDIDERTSAVFHEWCQKNNCYVPTINGFPYGHFHSLPVKEKVYLPDWRHTERVQYTKRLATLLDSWLPAEITGSISTVPVGFRNYANKENYTLVRQNLITALEHIDSLSQKSSKAIILSLEPEPGCVLETTDDIIRFFEQMNFPEQLRQNIGICFDCCHHAVEFEDPKESLSMLSEANIKIGKVQVSNALRVNYEVHIMKNKIGGDFKEGKGGFLNEILLRFCDPYYLHQTVIRQKDGSLLDYNDIIEALQSHHPDADEEWRIHFHVPVFVEKMDLYGTTRHFTEEILSIVDRNILLEVETYTWDILPSELRTETVTQSIIREIQWVQERVKERN
jgi:hypothetical protein